MSMHPQPIPAIPQETVRVARAVLPKSNVFLRMRDELGTLYTDEDFRDLFPTRGQPAEAPWRLALVTLMQYAEGLTDRQAADAVRTRIDWKYVLSLELTDSGFDFSVLSEFRSRLLDQGAERRLFDRLIEQFRERGWIKARGKQRTDSTHVLAAVRTLRRLECVGETMRHALNVLSEVAPEWLLEHMDPAWGERYEKRFSDFRLRHPTRRRGQNEPKRLERMGVGCSSRSAPKAACPGCGNWTPSKRCGECGCSSIMPASKAPRGVRTESCLPQRS
jgi:transposase